MIVVGLIQLVNRDADPLPRLTLTPCIFYTEFEFMVHNCVVD